ncbi:MAG TPA: single-stranded-DNA-specific exonuclease RecJ, partial [Burkholderiaceae bacterium]|nr:single-stranded-DNA-specific exonuclease RecJ [Burkholderiaceae bacterium]
LHRAGDAARLLADRIAQRAPMLVVGDYDCDGATAVAVAVLGLRSLGAVVDYLVPNRVEHGYGLSPDIVDAACAHPRLGRPALLITVDNGIASFDGIARAKALGLEVLVTDHHLPAARLPEATVIVNPNQPECRFASKHLAGVGVMFYLLLALRAELRSRGAFGGRDEPALQSLLDLVALGTVADVVRLDSNNRLLVAAGLRRIRAGRARPGIVALLQVAGRDARSASCADLGFAVAPRINAAGRLADISIGVECLLAEDFEAARALAERLDAINRDRRELESEMREEAQDEIAQFRPSQRALVAFRPGWHAGIVGLIASRLKDRIHRPVVALAIDERAPHLLKGSGRSIAGVHLRDVLDLVDKREPGLLLRFGGHAMAAGLTLAREQLPRFVAAFDACVDELADPGCFAAVVETDGGLADAEFNAWNATLIDRDVWGQGFPAPLFLDEFAVSGQRLFKDRHLKLELARSRLRLPAIAFGRTEPLPARALLAYRLARDDWRGPDAVSLVIEHVQPLG